MTAVENNGTVYFFPPNYYPAPYYKGITELYDRISLDVAEKKEVDETCVSILFTVLHILLYSRKDVSKLLVGLDTQVIYNEWKKAEDDLTSIGLEMRLKEKMLLMTRGNKCALIFTQKV